MVRQMFEEKFIRFPAGRTKAFTLSYDDGVEADRKLIEIMNEYRLKGTFNLNSQLFDCQNWHNRMNEEETYELLRGGEHEVAIHGARHIFLAKVPIYEAANEVLTCRNYLENKFGKIINGFAYPYNSYNDEVVDMLKMLGIKYARTTEASHSFALPENWLKLQPTCHHGDGRLNELAGKFLSADPNREFKNREGLLFYVWGHSYEFDDNGNWRIIKDLGKALCNKSDIWFATNIEIYNYVLAYRRLEFSVDGERAFNPSAIDVWLDMRGKTYCVKSGQTLVFDKEI